MKKPDDSLVTIAFAVFMGSAVALAITSDISAPICKAAAEAVPKDKFDFGCFEFWLNRYQGLLGNLITAAVAGATLLWVARQLTAANRQAAVAAAQGLRTIAAELEQEREAFEKTDRHLTAFVSKSLALFLEARTYDGLSGVQRMIEGHAAVLETGSKILRTQWLKSRYGKLNNLRFELFEALDENCLATDRALREVQRIQSLGLHVVREYSELERLFYAAQSEVESLEDVVEFYRNELEEEISLTWERIRSFEDSAVHGG